MKKIIFVIFFSLAQMAGAADFTVDGIPYCILTNSTVMININWDDNVHLSGDIIIPGHVQHNGIDYTVVKIDDGSLGRCPDVTSWTIPVTAYLYGNPCNAVDIYVQPGHPRYCSVDGILYSKDMKKLIRYPSHSKRSFFKIPASVTTIYFHAFNGCIYLKELVIPNSVTTIDDFAFSGYIGLSTIDIPASVTSIGGWAFGSDELKSVVLHQGLNTIGEGAFGGTGLTTVKIPASVTSIGLSAFEGIQTLKSIDVDPLNMNYSSIGGVFFDKKATTLIAYPAGKTDVTYTLPATVTKIGTRAFSHSKLSEINIPPSVTTIEQYAFDKCTNLPSINLPNSINKIGESVFTGCTALRSVEVDLNNKVFSSVDGVVYTKDRSALVLYPSGKTDSLLVLPISVNTITNSAFAGSRLYGLKAPGVTKIGEFAFVMCLRLKSLDIPKVSSIGYGAFFCTSLNEDILPLPVQNSFKDIFDVMYSKGKQ